jgi:hypothetical protein
VRRSAVLLFTCGLIASACTPQSASFELHTAELTCEEANRYVYDSMVGMGMQVTAFRPARPGADGLIKGSRGGPQPVAGEVAIACDATGVHIDPRQYGAGLDASFERGIFLAVTGRSGLRIDRGVVQGRDLERASEAGGLSVAEVREAEAEGSASAPAPASADTGAGAPARPAPANDLPYAPMVPTKVRADAPSAPDTVVFRMEPLAGFSSVLDFDADVSAAGLLPIRVRVTNGTDRAYDLDPDDLQVRVRGSRTRAEPLSVAEATARLEAAGGEIGDVAAAARIVRDKRLVPVRLEPGQSASGYVYYPRGDYDRAKVTLTDVATGELEGFLVEF